MKVLYRVKDNGKLLGYFVEDKNKKFFVDTTQTRLYNPSNAIILKDGTYKAKIGCKIETKEKSELGIDIRSRRTHSIGKPWVIANLAKENLSLTQRKILERLQNNNHCKFNKSVDNISIDMKDLSALTAYTGVEFSLFERNDIYIVYRGTPTGVNIADSEAIYLINNKFKWVGHTHPGSTALCLTPSDDDYETLKRFNQKRSVIYNSVGDFFILEIEK